MRFSRLVIEAGQDTVSLSIDPRLTVVAGVSAPVREVLADELLGGLDGSRSGTHLEMAEDQGRIWKVIRPGDRPHRVVESSGGLDITDEFSAPDGRVDVLGAHGIGADEARRVLHLDREALTSSPPLDPVIAQLAEVNQAELWSLAARVRVTDDEVRSLQQLSEDRIENADAVAKIERKHQSLETVIRQDQLVQRNLMRFTLFSLIGATAVGLAGSAQMYPLLAISAITGCLAAVYRARVARAERSEQSALADAGSKSYLGFVVKQVDGMMTGTEHRKRLMSAAEDHRSAAMAWTQRVGSVSVEWALEHQREINEAARINHELKLLQEDQNNLWMDDATTSLTRSLVASINRLRHIGRAGESFPLLLDDPFQGLDTGAKSTLMDLIARAAGSPQILVFTDDVDITNWARRNESRGGVSLVEPLGGSEPSAAAASESDSDEQAAPTSPADSKARAAVG